MTRPIMDQFNECAALLKIGGYPARDDEVTEKAIAFIEAEVAWLLKNSDATPELAAKAAGAVLGRMLAISGGTFLKTLLEGGVDSWVDQQMQTLTFADLINRFNEDGP